MQLLALLVLALPPVQEVPAPLSRGAISRLLRSLETGNEGRAEDAAQELLAAGTLALPYLADSLVRTEMRWTKKEGSLESAERVRALRMMIAASHPDALDVLLEQAGDPREAVHIRSQHALAVLPGDPSAKIIERWSELSVEQRDNSTLTLTASGTASAQDQLVAVLAGAFDDSDVTRFRSAMGLRGYEPEDDALAALEAAVEDPRWAIARAACSTLWSYGRRGVPGLLKAVVGKDKDTNKFAAPLLADLGDDARVPVLEALTKSRKSIQLLRVACIVAPTDKGTSDAFLALRGNVRTKLQLELLMALPELDLASDLRVEILAEALLQPKASLVEAAALSSLRLPRAEFMALSLPMRQAWLRPDASEQLLIRVAAAILRMELPTGEHLDWCAQRIALPDLRGQLIGATLAADVAAKDLDGLVAYTESVPSKERRIWLSALTGLGGAAETLLVQLANSASKNERPFILGFLATGHSASEAKLDLLRTVLSDSSNADFGAVLRPLAKFGCEAPGLLDPLLKTFGEFTPPDQALILRAAALCDPGSKRLSKVARESLAGSLFADVRTAAAQALSRTAGSPRSRITPLRAALKRGGKPKKGNQAYAGGSVLLVEEMKTQRKEHGQTAIAAIAMSLGKLEAQDSVTVEALGASLEGTTQQTIMVAEALRQLSPASASQGEQLAEFAFRDDLIASAACVRALAEIEGAGIHADSTLVATALIRQPELAGIALSGIEALSPEERAFSRPYLQCIAIRNSWPLTDVSWIRTPIDQPWAKEYEIPGPLRPNVKPLHQFEDVRARAKALLDE